MCFLCSSRCVIFALRTPGLPACPPACLAWDKDSGWDSHVAKGLQSGVQAGREGGSERGRETKSQAYSLAKERAQLVGVVERVEQVEQAEWVEQGSNSLYDEGARREKNKTKKVDALLLLFNDNATCGSAVVVAIAANSNCLDRPAALPAAATATATATATSSHFLLLNLKRIKSLLKMHFLLETIYSGIPKTLGNQLDFKLISSWFQVEIKSTAKGQRPTCLAGHLSISLPPAMLFVCLSLGQSSVT
ncbi:hypothetical protein DFJ73DRAFT_770329 [Zopfochytrium polystomum]|nr:hypothetical protein DFJ73DRAFT_770329 [Zopfochytrium polystomum]